MTKKGLTVAFVFLFTVSGLMTNTAHAAKKGLLIAGIAVAGAGAYLAATSNIETCFGGQIGCISVRNHDKLYTGVGMMAGGAAMMIVGSMDSSEDFRKEEIMKNKPSFMFGATPIRKGWWAGMTVTW